VIANVLVACGPDRAELAKEKFQTIPQMPGSVVVTTDNGVSGGSSEVCFGGYVETLYGTTVSQSAVISFYRQYAEANRWVVNEKSTSDWLTASTQDDYYLSLTFVKPVGPYEIYPSVHIFDPKLFESALSQFSTVYLFEVGYYPNVKNC
jgi:hypothetical protein